MKKFLLIIFLCPILFFLQGCDDKNAEKLPNYEIFVNFDEKNMVFECEQNVLYTNNESETFDKICFFLYANAFEGESDVVSKSYTEKAYPNGESFGKISIESVLIENEECDYEISEDKSILTVDLPDFLCENGNVDISMTYNIELANINHRLGYGDNAINCGNFFPIICPYDNGFVTTKFSSNGDPFFSEIADFSVEICVPNDYVVATSGKQEEQIIDGQKIVACNEKNLRDFCFVLSKKFDVVSEKCGKIDVNYYFYDDFNAKNHLKTAILALQTFQDLFGEYEYSVLNVVKTNFCFGGMEYPQLVMISDSITDEETINYVIVHEIAHQWWYGMVGNNEYENAWIDESLTEYSTALFFEKNSEYGLTYDDIVDGATKTYKNFVEVYSHIEGDVSEKMDRNLLQFDTEPEYVNCIYTKGILFFDSMRDCLGDKKFFKALKFYFKTNKFKIVTRDIFIQSFSKGANRNLKSFIESWIDGKVVIN